MEGGAAADGAWLAPQFDPRRTGARTGAVPSLVSRHGKFWPLGTFLKKLFFGRIQVGEIAAEFEAQLKRYIELVGQPPRLVNSHQHVAIFSPVGQALFEVLRAHAPHAYVRRVQEPWGLVWRVQGARKKRAFLNLHGRSMGRRQAALGFPGNDWLGGVTDPPWVRRSGFFEDWIRAIPGATVEMSCHPGYPDETLLGRDCVAGDGLLQRRVDELQLLHRPEFFQAVKRAGFRLIGPAELGESGVAHAA